MRIGDRDRKITIQLDKNHDVPDDSGSRTPNWIDYTTTPIWASVRPDSPPGSEKYADEQHTAKRYLVFNIRFLPGLAAHMRIVYEGQFYDIENFVELERRREVDITAYAMGPVSGNSPGER